MSLVAAAVLFGVVVLGLIKVRQIRVGGAIVCTVFGVLLALSPAGPGVYTALTAVGGWASDLLVTL